MNQSNKIFSIVKQFLSHRFPSDTEERVQRWIIKDEHSKEKEAASLDYWNELESEINSDSYLALEHVNTRIDNMQQTNSITKNEDMLPSRHPFIRRFSRVAAILIPLILIAGGYFYFSSFNQFIEIETAYGEEKHLILPDSSQIWLNAGTILKYPKKFKGPKRVVHLNGEAYFSVKKDDSKTFIVETGDLSVTVLGTQFNVKAYADEQRITTTLTSGKVEVRTPKDDTHILNPNEQLTYNRLSSSTNVIEIASSDTEAWRNGEMVFIDTPLSEILLALERKFNINISDNTNVPSSKLFTVKFLKDENLEQILEILHEMIGFSYQIENDQTIQLFTDQARS